jgi:hypothetical protein
VPAQGVDLKEEQKVRAGSCGEDCSNGRKVGFAAEWVPTPVRLYRRIPPMPMT